MQYAWVQWEIECILEEGMVNVELSDEQRKKEGKESGIDYYDTTMAFLYDSRCFL